MRSNENTTCAYLGEVVVRMRNNQRSRGSLYTESKINRHKRWSQGRSTSPANTPLPRGCGPSSDTARCSAQARQEGAVRSRPGQPFHPTRPALHRGPQGCHPSSEQISNPQTASDPPRKYRPTSRPPSCRRSRTTHWYGLRSRCCHAEHPSLRHPPTRTS